METLRKHNWLVIVCLSGFLPSFGMGLTNPVLSLYASGFGVSTYLVGVFITTFAFGRVVVTIPAGWTADRWGRRKLLLLGALINLAASYGIASIDNFSALLLFRFVQGVGSAFYMSAILLVIADKASPESRGRSNSAYQSSILLGLTISPVIGGLIANEFGMRAPFYAHSMLMIVVVIFTGRWFPNDGPEMFDTFSGRTSKSPPAESNFSLIMSLLRNRNFLLVSLAGFTIFVVRAGSRDTLLPLLGTKSLGLTTSVLGLIFTLIGLCNLVAIPISGWVTDHIGRKVAIVTGLAFMGISLWIVSAAPNYLVFMVGALLLGVGKGFSEPATIVYLTDIVPSQHFGSSFGLFLTLRDLGLFVGPVFFGWLADSYNLRLPLHVNIAVLFVVGILFTRLAMESMPKLSSRVE